MNLLPLDLLIFDFLLFLLHWYSRLLLLHLDIIQFCSALCLKCCLWINLFLVIILIQRIVTILELCRPLLCKIDQRHIHYDDDSNDDQKCNHNDCARFSNQIVQYNEQST